MHGVRGELAIERRGHGSLWKKREEKELTWKPKNSLSLTAKGSVRGMHLPVASSGHRSMTGQAVGSGPSPADMFA